MKYKKIKEDKNFTYYETEYGVGFVSSKHAYFDIQPERLKPRDVRSNVCDSPNSEYK